MNTLLQIAFWLPWSIGMLFIVGLPIAFIVEGVCTWMESGKQEPEQQPIGQETTNAG